MNESIKIRFIVMIPGYVESASTSCLIYQCGFFGNPGYASYKEAITDLALDLYAKFYDDCLSCYQNRYGSDLKRCCQKSLIDNKKAQFCSTCGCKLLDKKFDYAEFQHYVCNLTRTTCDSYGDAEETSTRNLTWWPYWITDFIGTPKEEVICLSEQAQLILLAALLEAKPELQDALDETDFSFCEWDKLKQNQQRWIIEQSSYR